MNIDHASAFIEALTGSASSNVHFQVYFDPKPKTNVSPSEHAKAEEWFGTLEDSLEFIQYKQEHLCGVYVCINETDGEGREEDNIIRFRTMLVDWDGTDEPDWIVPPHIINRRDSEHGHAFWLISDEEVVPDDWSALQRRLALFYGTDTQVIDPSRVIRLPGSFHYKYPNYPKQYFVEEINDVEKYSMDELFNLHYLGAKEEAKLNQWIEARKGIEDGTGFEDNKFEINRFTKFLVNAAYPAIQGSGTHEVFRVACYGLDHGIKLDTCQNLMWEYYNPRCEPPWEDFERNHFEGVIKRAYKYSSSVPGCKTAKAGFKEAAPLVEPKCGWDNQYAVFHEKRTSSADLDKFRESINTTTKNERSEYRIDSTSASLMFMDLTKKSSHPKFAQIFDGLVYNGTHIIRFDKTFFIYKNNHWEQIEDENVNGLIHNLYFSLELKASDITSISKTLAFHTVLPQSINPGCMISEPNKDTSNMIIFKNGVLDLEKDDFELQSHSPDLFNLNALPYDFDASAQCPNWIQFLNEIWEDDKQQIEMLQMWFGYCLTNDISLEKFAVFYGVSRGGKGTITTVLSELVGLNNVSSPSLDSIHENTSKEDMYNKSLCLIPEAEEVPSRAKTSILSTLKAIIGGDPINFHELYKGSRSAILRLKINLSSNNLPRFHDSSGALVARMIVFKFVKSYVGKEDFGLKDRLKGEISGIANWAIEGLKMLRANDNKFNESEMSLREKNQIKEDMNPLSDFFKKMCVIDENQQTTDDDIYASYKLWCNLVTTKVLPKHTFLMNLRNSQKGIKTEDRDDITIVHGIALKTMLDTGNVVQGNF